MKDIVIVGAGGVGREVALIISEINKAKPTWNVLGFIDDNSEKWGQVVNGFTILGGIEYLRKMDKAIYVIIAIANYSVKKRITGKLSSNFKYATIIHPKVTLNSYLAIGEGTIIYEGVILTANITIGKHVIISPKCGIGHDSVIKDYVSLLWNVNISGNDLIEEGAMFGSGSTIIQGKKVGKGSIVGAGAVVINDIPNNSTAVGVPAKVIKIMEE